jgi:hypothetical protein
MTELKIVFEGIEAEVAAEALVKLPDVTGSWTASDEVKRDMSLSTIAAIIGIASGTLSIATNLKKWYEDYQGSEQHKIENVVIITPKRRLLVDEATPEEILAFLKQAAEDETDA